MRADAMTWVQRAVGVVFLIGVLALAVLVGVQIWNAEGVPPLPVFVGILGLVGLILLAGACLALISIALSARQGAEMLRKLAAQGGLPVVQAKGPFTAVPLHDVATPEPSPMAAAVRPVRPAGRNLVAER